MSAVTTMLPSPSYSVCSTSKTYETHKLGASLSDTFRVTFSIVTLPQRSTAVISRLMV